MNLREERPEGCQSIDSQQFDVQVCLALKCLKAVTAGESTEAARLSGPVWVAIVEGS